MHTVFNGFYHNLPKQIRFPVRRKPLWNNFPSLLLCRSLSLFTHRTAIQNGIVRVYFGGRTTFRLMTRRKKEDIYSQSYCGAHAHGILEDSTLEIHTKCKTYNLSDEIIVL